MGRLVTHKDRLLRFGAESVFSLCEAKEVEVVIVNKAAMNLANYAVSHTVSACGGEGSGPGRKPKTKPAPTKQEFNTMPTFS